MTVIAFIANTSTSNGAQLIKLIQELEGGEVSCIAGNDLPTFQSCGRLGDVEVIVIVVFGGGNPGVLTELWPHCPRVRWVHSLAAGVDTVVPLMNALPRGPEIPLTNAKGAFSRSLAEYALGAMLHFNKQIPRLQQNLASRAWQHFVMNELHGKTAGFVGFGDIAQATARLCKAFGMRVLALKRASSPSGNELADAVYSTEADGDANRLKVFEESDFVVCTLPGGPLTNKFCGRAEFAVMRPTGVFISMGRGTCVDEAALAAVLQTEKIAGAALDVFAVEPLPAESPLWDCKSLLLSPHNADYTITYVRDTWDLFLTKLAEFRDPSFQGFAGTVDKQHGY